MVIKTVALAAALAASGFGLACSSSRSGDPVVDFPNHYSVMLENDAVRVLRITYQPGQKTAMHHHPEGIVIALAGTRTRFTLPDGTTEDVDLATDAARYMPAGEHSPENVGTTPLDAILVEFKRAQPGTTALPVAANDGTMTVLAEGAYGSAYRVTSVPTSEEPEGSTHEYDQVVIALQPAEVSVSVTGQAPKTTWARGDTMFIGRNVAHSSKNLSGAPVNYVMVAVK